MGNEGRPNQPLADAWNRILCEQADGALNLLRELYESDPAAAVHRLRKSLRRMRALLRLVRPAVGDGAWSVENAALRDLGRRLSPARDAVVMPQTLDHLLDDDMETAGALRQMLPAPAGVALPPGAEVTRVLVGVRERVAAWPLAGNRWSLVGKGLEATYRAGRRAARRARRNPGGEALHEWRKRAKELRYQLESLAPLQPEPLLQRTKELAKLCSLLGEEHDLSVLRETLGAVQDGPALERIDQRRRELWQEVERLGRELYGKKPARFLHRVREWWRGLA